MRNITRMTLNRWLPAEAVVARTDQRENVIWFDAGVDADAPGLVPRAGHPRRSLVGWGDEILRASAGVPGEVSAALRRVSDDLARGNQDHEPLGWWGRIGYGAGAELLAPGDTSWAEALGDPAHADLVLLRVERALVFDHDAGTVELVVEGDHRDWASELEEWWESPEAGALPEPGPPPRRMAEWTDSDEEYLELIRRCQSAIHDGDAFVLCLTTSVSVRGVDEGDLEIYRRLRRASPAPRACFVRLDGVSLLSATPETFLTVDRAGEVSSSPIKGTRPRGGDPLADEALVDELRLSTKERAENLMIVDLMRNDLSRISVPGGVEVTELLEVHSYEAVHQLVSTVRGQVRPGLTAVDVLRATFPPGSMTGAPKHSVVKLLGAWESRPRGIYSGAVGRFGEGGTLDLAVVIRSIVFDAATGSATIGVGGGITAASKPLEELDEIHTKARALLAVLGADPVTGNAFDDARDVSLI